VEGGGAVKKWYATQWGGVSEVEIAGETPRFVIRANGRKEMKRSDSAGYFDTREEAVKFMLDYYDSEITRHQQQIEWVQKRKERFLQSTGGQQ
jgi:hypothetical protein